MASPSTNRKPLWRATWRNSTHSITIEASNIAEAASEARARAGRLSPNCADFDLQRIQDEEADRAA